MTRPRYFAIFGAMRTGSNLIERTLDDYDGLVGLGELFNPGFIGKVEQREAFGATIEERNLDPVGFLEKAIAAHPGVAPGFRIFMGHDARMLDHAARDPSCAKIILRRDPVDSFISLEIAQATNQWMLRREENRRSAKIRFDPEKFKAYRARLDDHYAQLRRTIRAAGQGAFEIDYAELLDLELMNGVARYAGALETKDRMAPKIRKQNPADLSAKVENPEAAIAAAGPLPSAPRPEPEPHEHPLRRFTVSRGVELVYAPVPGAADQEVLELIRAAERRIGRDDKDIVTGLKGGQVERRRRRGTFVFSFIAHPALRLRAAYRRIVDRPGEFGAAHAAMQDGYGASGAATLAADAEAFESGFDAFIRFAGDCVAGRSPSPPDALWAMQSTLLAGYARETPVDFIGRGERFGADARYVLERLGLGAHADLAQDAPAASHVWLTAGREDAIYQAYERDYLRLGYARLT